MVKFRSESGYSAYSNISVLVYRYKFTRRVCTLPNFDSRISRFCANTQKSQFLLLLLLFTHTLFSHLSPFFLDFLYYTLHCAVYLHKTHFFFFNYVKCFDLFEVKARNPIEWNMEEQLIGLN